MQFVGAGSERHQTNGQTKEISCPVDPSTGTAECGSRRHSKRNFDWNSTVFPKRAFAVHICFSRLKINVLDCID